jgi:hypothetical protein
VVLPVESTKTQAGWPGTPKCANTAPSASESVGNVSLYLSMKPWNDFSVPDHATPTMVILSANFFASSSTEGASALHVLQVGAQNQKAAFLPTRLDPSNVPPPTSGLEKARDGGITTGFDTAVGAAELAGTAAELAVAAAEVAGAAAGALEALGAGAVVAAGATDSGLAAGFVVVVDAPQAVSARPKRAAPTAAARRRGEEARSGTVRVIRGV